MSKGLFLPYQARWINDKSRFKIAEKSRRTGLTYAQSYEDVEDCMRKNVPAVWFSSADITAAKEYILYCQHWASLFKIAYDPFKETVTEGEKTLSIDFANGTRINALSSSPKAFRSKGGKVVLDEFAFHEHAQELWKAALPSATSMAEYPVRIISTHNGKSCLYYKLLEQAKKGKKGWSHHTIDIHSAVAEGLADKNRGRALTQEEREEWLEEVRQNCGIEEVWNQEYCCIPVDETTAFFTYNLIQSCERDDIARIFKAKISPSEIIPEIENWLWRFNTDIYLGVDIGRENDLTVLWVLQKIGASKITVAVIELEKMPYSAQQKVVDTVFSICKPQRSCFDATGIGDNFAETNQEKYGSNAVEKVKFTSSLKETLATDLRIQFEDQLFLIPPDEKIKADLHSIKKVTTAAGNQRFDVDKNSTDKHADRFWAAALANHAASNPSQPLIHCIGSRGKRKSYEMLKGF